MDLSQIYNQIPSYLSSTLSYAAVVSLICFASFARQGGLKTYWLKKNLASLNEIIKCPSIIILLCCTLLAYFAALYWSPENLLSGSVKWIDSESLAIKVAEKRRVTPNNLSADDLELLELISNRRGRALYAVYGPDALLHCMWCHPDAVWTYILFNLPYISLPYLLACVLIGLFITDHGSTRRGFLLKILGIFLPFAFMIADLITILQGADPVNFLKGTAAKTDGSNLLFWTLHFWRYTALSFLCFALAVLRLFQIKSSSCFQDQTAVPPEKYILEIQRKVTELSQFTKAGIVINKTIKKSPQLLETEMKYWKREALLHEIIEADSNSKVNQ